MTYTTDELLELLSNIDRAVLAICDTLQKACEDLQGKLGETDKAIPKELKEKYDSDPDTRTYGEACFVLGQFHAVVDTYGIAIQAMELIRDIEDAFLRPVDTKA